MEIHLYGVDAKRGRIARRTKVDKCNYGTINANRQENNDLEQLFISKHSDHATLQTRV